MKSNTSSRTTSTRVRSTNRPGKRILLVDDDSTVRDSLNDVLVSRGYSVIPAENGQQALALANESSVDLVLLIIATARPNQLFTAINAGVGALLEKPMDIPMLLRTMEKLLSETAGQRLARLAGQKAEFHYQPSKPRRD